MQFLHLFLLKIIFGRTYIGLHTFVSRWEAAPHHHSAVFLPRFQEELQQLRDREAQQRQKHDEQLKEMRLAGGLKKLHWNLPGQIYGIVHPLYPSIHSSLSGNILVLTFRVCDSYLSFVE